MGAEGSRRAQALGPRLMFHNRWGSYSSPGTAPITTCFLRNMPILCARGSKNQLCPRDHDSSSVPGGMGGCRVGPDATARLACLPVQAAARRAPHGVGPRRIDDLVGGGYPRVGLKGDRRNGTRMLGVAQRHGDCGARWMGLAHSCGDCGARWLGVAHSHGDGGARPRGLWRAAWLPAWTADVGAGCDICRLVVASPLRRGPPDRGHVSAGRGKG